MKSHDIRQSFLDFFKAEGHKEIPSAPLVPHGDPTLLFTNAGMVQFKDVFLGNQEREAPRAVTAQKCLRVSGKHNDLENVGPSPRHHTFFEMLGNFSFGDYFKEEAIRFGWKLVTEGWGLDPNLLFATVFEEDDEAEELWRKISGLPAERVLRCGAKDNFWQMGDTGPCGPCSEIFVDLHPDRPHVDWEEGSENGRYLEIWNLVFMQFDRGEDGQMRPLPNPSIDTGAGLERVAAVLNRVDSNYSTDLFLPILQQAAEMASTKYGADAENDVSLRVIADHIRAVSFLLADGVIPGPDGRGYVLRRILRRAVRHGLRIGFEEPFFHRLVPTLSEILGGHYDELVQTADATRATIRAEEEKYLDTLASGARRVQEAVDRTRAAGGSTLSADELFQLYDTYGQELETVHEIAEEERLGVDVEGFERLLEERRARSRVATAELQKRMKSLRAALQVGEESEATAFTGYDRLCLEGVRIRRLAATTDDGAEERQALEAGQTGVAVVDRTVFYAEGGGQVGDQGGILWSGENATQGKARIVDTQKDTAGTVFHFLEVTKGRLEVGAEVTLAVDEDRRRATERHHTATHLLHAALHRTLGEGARQAGSLVAPDRLRFDFTHNQPLTDDELRSIEDDVNREIRRATPTDIRLRGRDEAMEAGAMALFGEKYGDEVRTVEIPGCSLELCGGCHVRNTGEIALLLLTGERGVASGVRRIEAVTGETALAEVRRRQELLEGIERGLGVDAERVPGEAEAMKERIKNLERELAEMRRELVAGQGSGGGGEEVEVAGVKVTAREVPKAPTGELRNLADTLRDKMGSGVVVLGSRSDGKASVIVTVSKDLTKKLNAGKLVKALAALVGGSGGGRPDFAQAGGKEPDKLPEMLAAVPGVVEEALSS